MTMVYELWIYIVTHPLSPILAKSLHNTKNLDIVTEKGSLSPGYKTSIRSTRPVRPLLFNLMHSVIEKPQSG